MEKANPDSLPVGRRLGSWKEIAAHLGRAVRTVQRWEREQGLPVHRLPHNKLSSVYAYSNELDEWWELRRNTVEPTDMADSPPETPDPATESAASITERAESLETPVTVREAGLTGATPLGRSPARLTIFVAVIAGALATWMAMLGVRQVAIQDANRSSHLVARGRLFLNQRTPSGFREALKAFEQAAAVNPSDATAHSGLADTYSLMQAFGVMPKEQALPRARVAARRAIDLAPESAQARASMSLALWESGEQDAAVSEAEHAVAVDPKYATGQHWYALYLYARGEKSKAIDHAERAHAIDPMSPIIVCDLSIMLRSEGRVANARQLLESALAAHPTFPQLHVELSEVYRLAGRNDLALVRMQSAIDNGDDRPAMLARLAWLADRNGDRKTAVGAAARVERLDAEGVPVPPAVLAQALAAAGDMDRVLALIEAGVRAREGWVARVAIDPPFESVRLHPRWSRLYPEIEALARTTESFR